MLISNILSDLTVPSDFFNGAQVTGNVTFTCLEVWYPKLIYIYVICILAMHRLFLIENEFHQRTSDSTFATSNTWVHKHKY